MEEILQPHPEIEENSLVSMKDEILPHSRWKLERNIQLHPGKEKIASITTFRVCTGTT